MGASIIIPESISSYELCTSTYITRSLIHRCDGSLLGGGDTLLHGTHVSGQGGLVTDSRGDKTEQGRHLRTSLGEPEDIVDEEQHVLALLVTEVLSNSQS